MGAAGLLCPDTASSLPCQSLPRQPLPRTCAEADDNMHCRAHSPHPKHGSVGWPSPGQPKCPPNGLCGRLQWLSYPSACNTACASLGNLCGKKSASKTVAAKDGGVAKASKSTFKSLLELAGLWKRGLEETSGGQLPLPTPQGRSCSALAILT